MAVKSLHEEIYAYLLILRPLDMLLLNAACSVCKKNFVRKNYYLKLAVSYDNVRTDYQLVQYEATGSGIFLKTEPSADLTWTWIS